MVFRPKKPSPLRSKRMARRARNSLIGTHVPTQARAFGPDGGSKAPNVGFANTRRAARAQQGVVDQVMPDTSSRESEAQYSKRSSKQPRSALMQRRAKIRRTVLATLAVFAAAVLAGGVGVAAYFGSVSAKLGLGDSNVAGALVAQEKSTPYYVLLAGEFSSADRGYDGPDTLMLARIDEQGKKVALLSIPANYQISLKDGKSHRLAEAQLLGGDAYLSATVADIAGVKISHFIKIDGEGLVKLVDALGGVTLDVPEEVDDPMAGSIYLPPGTQKLDGAAALVLCRATNYKEGHEVRLANQRALAVALAMKLLDTNALSLVPMLDSIAGPIRTDYSASEIMSLVGALRGIDPARIHTASMPGSQKLGAATQTEYFISSEAAWKEMMAAVKAGEDPAPDTPDAPAADLSGFEVTVRNGAEITGAAKQVAEVIERGGFTVAEVGNAEQFVYKETLVVYQDEAHRASAEAVAHQIGTGRVIAANGFYTFDTEVLVVLGSDWKPLA